ncbi:transposase [Streptomyces griseorubiginosus]
MALDDELDETDALIERRFRDHPYVEIILSTPGLGPVLGAEFIAHTGGGMNVFGSPDRLAGVAGLAPVPQDSGRISGNMRRPCRYCRRLMRVFYMPAQVAARCCPTSKAFYDRKRALARRRLNVLWALLRDNRPLESSPPFPVATLG